MPCKFVGLSIWVWVLILSIILLSIYCSKENFTDVENTKKIKVLNFNTHWCGWSKRFQPEWDKFSKNVKSNPKLIHIEAIDVKCDNKDNKMMCEAYDIPGFPFVLIEKDGKKIPYEGERTSDALETFIEKL